MDRARADPRPSRQRDRDAHRRSSLSSGPMFLPLSALWLAAHGAYRARGFRSRLLRAGERNLHLYDRRGEGTAPPVLLVHGMGGNAAGFLPIVRAVLRASRRVVALELPGHGRSILQTGEAPATIR